MGSDEAGPQGRVPEKTCPLCGARAPVYALVCPVCSHEWSAGAGKPDPGPSRRLLLALGIALLGVLASFCVLYVLVLNFRR